MMMFFVPPTNRRHPEERRQTRLEGRITDLQRKS
jgi:hypothetical protein